MNEIWSIIFDVFECIIIYEFNKWWITKLINKLWKKGD